MQQYTPYNQEPATMGPVFSVQQIKSMALSKLSGKWKAALIPVMIYLVLALFPAMVVQVLTNPDLGILTGGVANSINTFFSIYDLIVSGGFLISLATLTLRIIRNEDFDNSIVLSGFHRFGQSFCTYFLANFFSILWSILIMLPGIILMSIGMVSGSSVVLFFGALIFFGCAICAALFIMRYQMSYFIASDDRYMPASEAVSRSVAMMRGNITSLFVLQLSFIGWAILASVPLGICSGLFYMAHSTGLSAAYFAAFIFLVAGIVTYGYLFLYMHTANAIFYSGMSGNFRTNAQTADPQSENFEYKSIYNDSTDNFDDVSDNTASSESVADEENNAGAKVSLDKSSVDSESYDDSEQDLK